MKTFKWTVPEPRHGAAPAMRDTEFDYWRRVRRRGPEWFVVGKGLLFLLTIPLASRWLRGEPVGFEILTVSWVLGLVAGTCVWMLRERRFARALAEGARDAEPLP